MRITIINVCGRLSSDGSRLISALLKRAGHQVRTVFLARQSPLAYESRELEPLGEILRESDLVMVAVYSTYAIRAVQVTEFVHKTRRDIKVIWGGPHCISVPELALRHADGVCFAEGDQAIVDFVNKVETGTQYLDTPNMGFRVEGSIIINQVLPPFSALDTLPYYDYDLDQQFLLDNGLLQMTKERLIERHAHYPFKNPILYYVTSRGCPHNCSYCNNCRYVKMFGHNSIRYYSVDRVINELEYTLRQLDFFSIIGFADDDFFTRPINILEDFAKKYKRRIGLPFGIAISANTFSKQKLELLLDSGLKLVQMGIQSGSQNVIENIYNRKVKISKTKEVIDQISDYTYSRKLRILLDFIIDNPYESRDDIIKTYQYIVGLPPSTGLNLFHLAFFPGTPIYARALNDGIIEPYSEQTFRFYTKGKIRYQRNYETFLVLAASYLRCNTKFGRKIPRLIFSAAGTRFARSIASVVPHSFFELISGIIH